MGHDILAGGSVSAATDDRQPGNRQPATGNRSA
jgi:hypothetical protein